MATRGATPTAGFRAYAKPRGGRPVARRPGVRVALLAGLAAVLTLALAWAAFGRGGDDGSRVVRISSRDAAGEGGSASTRAARIADATSAAAASFVPFKRAKKRAGGAAPGAGRAGRAGPSDASGAATNATDAVARHFSRDTPHRFTAEDAAAARKRKEEHAGGTMEYDAAAPEEEENAAETTTTTTTATTTTTTRAAEDEATTTTTTATTDAPPPPPPPPSPPSPQSPSRPPPRSRHRPRDASSNSVGFLLQMAREPKASLEIVKATRERYPSAPIRVVSDAGYDCSRMCEIYACNFTLDPTASGYGGKGDVMVWLQRLAVAAEAMNTTWMVYLEDDVSWNAPGPGGIRRWPRDGVDAGGVDDRGWGTPMTPALSRELAKRAGGKRPREHYGLCGGSVLRVDALLRAVGATTREDLKTFQARSPHTGPHTTASAW